MKNKALELKIDLEKIRQFEKKLKLALNGSTNTELKIIQKLVNKEIESRNKKGQIKNESN